MTIKDVVTGQDGLRDEIAREAFIQHATWEDTNIHDLHRDRAWYERAWDSPTSPGGLWDGRRKWYAAADAVLAKVQAHIDAAREQVAEQLANVRAVDDLRMAEIKQIRAEHDAAMARAEAAEQAVAQVRKITYAMDDGTEYEHNGHAPYEGEPECPGCWAASIRRALPPAPEVA